MAADMTASRDKEQGEDMPKADLISGILLMVFGLAMLFWIIPAQTDQDTGAAVPPDLLPQICVVGITILAGILTVNAARGTTPPSKAPKLSEWSALVGVLAIVIVGTVLFTHVHTAVGGFFVSLATMLYMGERRWYLLIALPSVLVLSIYLLFYEFLGTAIL